MSQLMRILFDNVIDRSYRKERASIRRDAAMGATVEHPLPETFKRGGIDLTPANMNLQMQNNGAGIKFHLDPAQLAQLQNAPGFVPVIINIHPLTSLSDFLGINEKSGNSLGAG